VNRRPYQRAGALPFLLAVVLLGPSSSAWAIRVEFGFGTGDPAPIWQLSGTVTAAGEIVPAGGFPPAEAPEVVAALAARGVVPGVHWSGELTFIPNAVGFQSSSDPRIVDYPASSALLAFNAGSFSTETPDSASGAIQVALFGPVDGNALIATAPVAGGGRGLAASSATLTLVTFAADAFASGFLPQHSRDLPPLADATRIALLGSVLVGNPGPTGPVLISAPFEIDGSLGSIVPEPEPATALLAALAALGALRRHRATEAR
jgi:hypothetical protein